MSIIESGLSDIYSITAQIEALKNNATSMTSALSGTSLNNIDPKEAIYNLQLNFNEMLNSLLATSEDDEDSKKTDPFAFLFNNYNQLSSSQKATSSTTSANAATGITGVQSAGALDQSALQYAAQVAQSNLDLSAF